MCVRLSASLLYNQMCMKPNTKHQTEWCVHCIPANVVCVCVGVRVGESARAAN